MVIGKGDWRYWTQPGKLILDSRSRAFSCKIQIKGRRESFPLRQSSKSKAAQLAAKIYSDVVVLGWDAAIKKHKPESEKKEKGTTVGEFIEAVSKLANVRQASLRGYARSLRRIVGDVGKIKATPGRYARCGTNREWWLAAVNRMPLEKLTPSKIEAWKISYVAQRSEGNESKARAARNSANSIIRMAKALFSKRLLRLVGDEICLPSPLPFDGVEMFPRQSMRYVSTMDVSGLIRLAQEDLAANDPEAFKAFLLGLFAGLRRSEVDRLRWRSVDFLTGVIRVEAHHDFAPKAEASLGEVPVDSEVLAILRGLRAREPDSEYVLSGDSVSIDGTWVTYRAEDTFKRLMTWLRSNGVAARSPLHTLRKEAGSLVCQRAGIYAASRFLRHADIAITAQHYTDQKDRVTVGLGGLLKGGKRHSKVIPMVTNQDESQSGAGSTAGQDRQVS